MAIKQWYEEQFISAPGIVSLLASCVGNGAANPTTFKGPAGMSVTWVSTGKYTITLPKKFNGLVGADFTVINTAGTTLSVVFPSADAVAASGTITIEVFGGLTAAAPARRDLTSADKLLINIQVSDTNTRPAQF